MSIEISSNIINPIAYYNGRYINLLNNNIGEKGILFNEDSVLIEPTHVKERDVLYCSGPSGSGKSTIINKFINRYTKLHPKNNIFLFSNVKEDDSFNENKKLIKRIRIDSNLIEDPINIKEELKDSLVIMDDVDMISNKIIRESVLSIREEILTCGRHYNISCAISTHQLTNYTHTRTILNESNLICFFPKSGSLYHIQRFLKMYCGLSNKQIGEILKIDSRWICIKKDYPLCVISSNLVGMIE